MLAASHKVDSVVTNYSKTQYHRFSIKLGSCPICDYPMTASMLELIKLFKEKYQSNEVDINKIKLYSLLFIIFNFPN
jgi:hypothetical protein